MFLPRFCIVLPPRILAEGSTRRAARQIEDPNFTRKYPDWGSEAFWRKEVTDLERQRDMIEQHL